MIVIEKEGCMKRARDHVKFVASQVPSDCRMLQLSTPDVRGGNRSQKTRRWGLETHWQIPSRLIPCVVSNSLRNPSVVEET